MKRQRGIVDGNIIVAGTVALVLIWGATGVAHGVKWTWQHKGCIVRHGIKACKTPQP